MKYAYGNSYTQSSEPFTVDGHPAEKSFTSYIGKHTGTVIAGDAPVYVTGYQYLDSEPIIIPAGSSAIIKLERKGDPSVFSEISVILPEDYWSRR